MECEKGESKGDLCDLAIGFESGECGESKSVCKKPVKPQVYPTASPQCVPEGKSCEGGKECCDDMECEKGESKGDLCDLAIGFESGECGESKSVRKKPVKPQVYPTARPQCVPEGKSCDAGKECCDDMVCKKGKGKGDNCDLAIALKVVNVVNLREAFVKNQSS